MAVVLEAKDAGEWTYRGEGAVNLVLAYNGTRSDFVGKVLRIQKVPRNGSENGNGYLGLTNQECILWKEVNEIVSAPTREIAQHYFVQHVMCPLLGPGHVDAGISIQVTQEFLETVESNVLSQRPAWRVDAAKVNPLCDSVMLMSDHSMFPLGMCKEACSISVEIKPKCGFLPHSEFITEDNAVKKSVTRFQMHQALKLNQGKISEVSAYDPLDLFSGSRDRVRKAINNLFKTPQNNFRVFLDGSLIIGGLGGGADTTSCEVGKAFENSLKHVIQAEEGMRTQYFLELISKTVCSSELLNRLLEVQKLDTTDIEGAIHAYYNVISQPCMVCGQLDKDQSSKRYNSLHSMSMEESLKIVRDYLIAATAKDLSMIISFRPREAGNVETPYSIVSLESTNQSFDYKASFIDLDLKPLERIEYYYKLDQQIVSCYVQMVKSNHQLDHTGSTVRA
ncbi:inositol-pentakisphosphate 2-kinase-like [Nicotiana sylvestris]|uniref:Inositol-pentakisphosphate 2-kinase n=1 Tax=Nicotiana sylvestris TaxID=4096 RepID=A0A1U7XTK9_NICSY|nr:PREDICTED: inositol-pentakisphosphate 2-kinase-like [Nicotiana sylvestris]XP_009792965.1 PREDICTED: inositol-pentakisphosphate 2-kinase-like [Nicotiana sylvestris]XP_009792966.1 PREDICTED: inositol-pentakisphosphate 2-kinase-like [Nicotiana sylvestris]XP_009792967.1 PREDICTED: inositol-pentakisphosphate 2-kinase-like [Nicotiana sylvestris]XP_009792968.1 PREDICTED: inositol-pentakisphosphate 2-kinase-like [Nicotiana sylvestris]XP_009792969.1 PREDICTED: inositol-pentakisphosphate 2-kinase-lik